jgi:hypothetical protein
MEGISGGWLGKRSVMSSRTRRVERPGTQEEEEGGESPGILLTIRGVAPSLCLTTRSWRERE